MLAKESNDDKKELQEARDKLVLAARRWRVVDAGDIGIRRLLAVVNDLAAAVDDYEKVRKNGR